MRSLFRGVFPLSSDRSRRCHYFFHQTLTRGWRISIAPFVCSSEKTEIRLSTYTYMHIHRTRTQHVWKDDSQYSFSSSFIQLSNFYSVRFHPRLHFSTLSIKGHNLWRNVIRSSVGMLHYSNVSQIPLSHPILKTVSIFASHSPRPNL